MNLADTRRAIRPLLDERQPFDAQAYYYAFNHPDEKIQLVTYPPDTAVARGYICLARTGIDLFRPLVTLRLPDEPYGAGVDLAAGARLVHEAIPAEMSIIVSAPAAYRPLLAALLDIHKEEPLSLHVLDRGRFQPIINILVTRSESYDGLPRFIVRQTADGQISELGEIVASAGLNWRTQRFAEVYVHTKSPHRRKGLGRSVVAAVVQDVLNSGRLPLYVANTTNQASILLAESVGFVNIGANSVLIEGTVKPPP